MGEYETKLHLEKLDVVLGLYVGRYNDNTKRYFDEFMFDRYNGDNLPDDLDINLKFFDGEIKGRHLLVDRAPLAAAYYYITYLRDCKASCLAASVKAVEDSFEYLNEHAKKDILKRRK